MTEKREEKSSLLIIPGSQRDFSEMSSNLKYRESIMLGEQKG
jgi:hypothetical protein